MSAESRFHTILKGKISKLVLQRQMELGQGTAQDYAAYQFLVGNLTGLREALSLCEETEREFDV